jgi:hypothetical protein
MMDLVWLVLWLVSIVAIVIPLMWWTSGIRSYHRR